MFTEVSGKFREKSEATCEREVSFDMKGKRQRDKQDQAMEVNSLNETWEGVDAHLYQKVTTSETCGDSSISPTLLHKQENLRTQNPCKTCVVGNIQLVLPVQRRQSQEKPCYLGARSWASSASSMFSEKSCFKKRGGANKNQHLLLISKPCMHSIYLHTHTCAHT